MAYGGYFPQGYYQNPQSYYGAVQGVPQAPQNVQAQSSSGITWVQGEAAAKAFPVGAGQSVLLMDSEDSVMYIKSMDPSGMPRPLRVFDYTERSTGQSENTSKSASVDYVSRTEFEEFREDVKRSIKGIRKPKIDPKEEDHGESLI